jgi:phosphoribosylamine---glycine ligase
MKNAMVIGGGGREHTFVDALKASSQVERVDCYHGNGGTSQICDQIEATIKLDNPRGLLGLATFFKADLTVIGPELPAIHGVADVFAEAGKAIVCPSMAASKLEGSKIAAKRFMKRHHIPTARSDEYYTADDIRRAAEIRDWRCVVKADGLCGGKGVYVCHNITDVERAIKDLILDHIYDHNGTSGVVEDLLDGPESSHFTLADGKTYVECGTAGDYKRAYNNDEGPNTGGMGAHYPSPYISRDEKLHQRIVAEIVQRTFDGLAEDGIPYQGFLYFGLMLTRDGPKLLEYNVRFGDPEAQVVIPMIKTDMYDLLFAAATGGLSGVKIDWHFGARIGVVATTNNYPRAEVKGHKALIEGPIRSTDGGDYVKVYHGATVLEDGHFWATQGRVLTISALGSSYQPAMEKAYQWMKLIHFSGMRYRADIGIRAMAAEKDT